MSVRFSRLHFLGCFALVVLVLLVVKWVNPAVALERLRTEVSSILHPQPVIADSIGLQSAAVDSLLLRPRPVLRLLTADGQPVRNRVTSVAGFAQCFPDSNALQLASAQRLGLAHIIETRAEAPQHTSELVFIGDNPFYRVETLRQSIPYLVPRAATLLNEIARAFVDSCATKGVGLHKLVVTSVTRTREDVQRLRRFNANASDQSCHQYGTTFDIGYNKYDRVFDPDGPEVPTEWGTKLKAILAEVLEDQRELGTCYVKYEHRKPCFHVTCR